MSGKGYFFNQEDSTPGLASQVQDEVLASETGSLGLLEENRFQPIHTAWIALLQLILFVAFETLQFVLANENLINRKSLSLGGPDAPFRLFVVLHVALWVLVFISDRILQCQHHKSQKNGYLQFFRETKELRRLPHAILSLGINYYGYCSQLCLRSVVRTYKKGAKILDGILNRKQKQRLCQICGDKQRVLWYFPKWPIFSSIYTLSVSGPSWCVVYALSIAFHFFYLRDNDYLDEVLEKQADMIRYLQQHNANLGKRLMKLTTQQRRNSLH
ncbi:PREDICTED: transmembrane protein 192-like [Acropora digitifera]|uniref:transmembrane protein 192-like n=1 Tax=Acropora digitifera TaxID=70779 RepID=UPI00077AE958|nr:PREDICTED: transmembrane protein 192-like [Acropora digitifera]